MSLNYHVPVLLNECIEGLAIKPDGVYVDVTFGGGGHSKAILEKLGDKGRLFGFDQDEDARQNALNDNRFTFVQANFKDLKAHLRLNGVKQVDGILADLGVSSHQFDVAERGFSYRFDAKLDMRMNQQGELDAAMILNNYSAEELQKMFSEFGEVRNSKTLAHALVAERQLKNIQTISDLVNVLEKNMMGDRMRYFSQVFQALRMEVNQEVEVLNSFFEQSMEVLKEGGRLVVLSYHSIEDRLAKNYMKAGSLDGEYIKDFYGNIHRPFKLITKKAVEPDEKEIKSNSRARSAKLRIAERI